MSILENIQKDSQDGLGVQVDDDELKSIAKLAEEQTMLEAVIKEAELQLKGHKEKLKQIAELQLSVLVFLYDLLIVAPLL